MAAEGSATTGEASLPVANDQSACEMQLGSLRQRRRRHRPISRRMSCDPQQGPVARPRRVKNSFASDSCVSGIERERESVHVCTCVCVSRAHLLSVVIKALGGRHR